MTRHHDFIVLFSRLLLSLLFIIAGFNKIGEIAQFEGRLMGIGFPMPGAVSYAVCVVEILGGLAILLGVRVRLVATGLAFFCVASALVGHVGPGQLNNFLKNLGLTGGFLLLASHGPGALSWDAWRIRSRDAL